MDTDRQFPGGFYPGPSMDAIVNAHAVHFHQSPCAQSQAERHTDPGTDADEIEDDKEHQVAGDEAACKEDILSLQSSELDGSVNGPVDGIFFDCLHFRDQKSFG